jgi:hypothetical protein
MTPVSGLERDGDAASGHRLASAVGAGEENASAACPSASSGSISTHGARAQWPRPTRRDRDAAARATPGTSRRACARPTCASAVRIELQRALEVRDGAGHLGEVERLELQASERQRGMPRGSTSRAR